MSVKDMVADRFLELCGERKIRPNELAVLAGVTPSTVYSMLNPKRRDVSVVTVKKLCDGLDVTEARLLRSDPGHLMEHRRVGVNPR